jgi:hypothetical protein
MAMASTVDGRESDELVDPDTLRMVYIVSTEPVLGAARRLAPGTTEFVSWTGRPIEPLGGLTIELVDGEVAVRTPDGRIASDDSALYGLVLAEAAEAKAEVAEARVRAAVLEAKLRALGVDP